MDEKYSLQDFENIKELGKGSFSNVRLVKRKRDGKLLALKEVNMDRLTMGEKNLALNEVRLLASISSPFIISYHGSFFSSKSNSLCLLMEYAEEGDLEALINLTAKKHKMKKGLPEEFIWRSVIHILQGLRTMHCNKMAHRDLKSANIFFSNGVAKLGDLNVSTVSENSMYQTKTGTPYYTAPEIWKGQAYTNKCDIWSLGCIIYEMCSLQPPFKASNFPELFILISKGHYCPLAEQYSDELRTLVRMCINVMPEQRPSAVQLLENSLIIQKQVSLQTLTGNKENVKLISQIKCPKRIRFINEILPKPNNFEQREGLTSSLEKINQSIDKKSTIVSKNSNKIRIKKQKTQKCISFGSQKQSEPTSSKLKAQKSLRIINQAAVSEMKSEKKMKSEKCRHFRVRSQKKVDKENCDDK